MHVYIYIYVYLYKYIYNQYTHIYYVNYFFILDAIIRD